jgi:hypothetical protein
MFKLVDHWLFRVEPHLLNLILSIYHIHPSGRTYEVFKAPIPSKTVHKIIQVRLNSFPCSFSLSMTTISVILSSIVTIMLIEH